MIRFPGSLLPQPWAHCLPDGWLWRLVLPALSQLCQQGRVQRTGLPRSTSGPKFCPSLLLPPGIQALLLVLGSLGQALLSSQRVPAGLFPELYSHPPPIPRACQSLRPSRHQ